MDMILDWCQKQQIPANTTQHWWYCSIPNVVKIPFAAIINAGKEAFYSLYPPATYNIESLYRSMSPVTSMPGLATTSFLPVTVMALF